ncbi:hypothetical protein [Thalassomonas actiniarum]|uniref:Uncharacterized protein n=1 Tax=Thalassomonas actiniarum TaxID=485447 RepID=A0AAF0C6L2_9GAMM|nr:hypothetical protein [Thalassomonas actiniarum]WDE02205.1 hypothetical protein SG35_031095 [Thalassomonas actiniarum]
MSNINTVSNQGSTYSNESTTNATANKDDVESFEKSMQEALDKIETEQFSPEETTEALINGMIKMSMGGVSELFKKQMIEKPENKLN